VQITRIKPGGWLIILILIGLIFFGFRTFKQRLAPGSTTPASSTATGSDGSFLTPTDAAGGNILVSTTKTKEKWMRTQIDKFNAQSQSGKVKLNLTESRESMQDILNDKLHPTIWSPSSPVWTSRVADYWPQTHGGQKIADLNRSDTYRVLFKSPLVFVTTKEKAGFLRPLLGGATPWENVRQLGSGQKKCPWGRFKFAYADPLNASSGTLTMSLIITEYARAHGQENDLNAAASSPGFAAYLRQVNRAYVRGADNAGSSKLEKAFAASTGSRDFITAYENAALAALDRNPDLALIYPSPTANADQGVLILTAPWVSDSQAQTAHAFLDFLGTPEALSDGVQYYFRPTQGGSRALANRLSAPARAQFQASPVTVDLPPYEALNEAAARWNEQMKNQ